MSIQYQSLTYTCVYIESKTNKFESNQCFCFVGPVDKVEIKQKKATDSDEVQNTFAFVTIAIDEHALQQCLQEFKAQPYRGQYLQVTVARENFLEKLKREREEAAQFKPSNTSQSSNTHTEIVNATLPIISTGNSDESESSSSESSEDENASENPSAAKRNGVKKIKSSASDSSDSNDSQLENNQENLILKKKSKIFLENGKVSNEFVIGIIGNCKTISIYFLIVNNCLD